MVRIAHASVLLFGLVVSMTPRTAVADEIWIAPTYQQDLGGVGIGSNALWPVTAVGAARLVLGVPDNLATFQAASIALIPHAPGGSATLNVFVCTAENGDLVGAACAGPFAHPFVGVPNRLVEIDISGAVAPRVGGAGANHLAIVAYTAPTTTTDHIVGLRFKFVPPSLPASALAFDPTTQQELDLHAADPSAHHPRYTDAEAVAAAGVTSLDDLAGLACGVAGAGGTTHISVDADGGIAFSCVPDGEPPPPPSDFGLILTPGGATAAGKASFGPSSFDITASVVVAADSGGASPSDACEPLIGDVAGRIVLVDRGNCAFSSKAQRIQAASGMGMIVADNVADAPPPDLGSTGDPIAIVIPSLSISQTSGGELKTALSAGTVLARMFREGTVQ